LKSLLEPVHVALGLAQMLLDRVFQHRGAGLLGDFGQRFDQLLFGVIHVLQLVKQQVLQ